MDHAIATFVVRSLHESGVLQSELGPTAHLGSGDIPEALLAKIAGLASRELLVADSPFLCTVRMQVGMEQTFRREKASVESELVDRDGHLEALLAVILDPALHEDMSQGDFERLWQKVVDYAAVKGSMDAALTVSEARIEVAAAVESVLPVFAMPRFVGLSSDEKAAQLDEVASIVQGICVLNASLGRGGSCLPSSSTVGAYLHQSNMLAREIEARASEAHDNIRKYLALIKVQGSTEGPQTPAMARLRQELTNLQQEMAYLIQLREDVLGGMDTVCFQSKSTTCYPPHPRHAHTHTHTHTHTRVTHPHTPHPHLITITITLS